MWPRLSWVVRRLQHLGVPVELRRDTGDEAHKEPVTVRPVQVHLQLLVPSLVVDSLLP